VLGDCETGGGYELS